MIATRDGPDTTPLILESHTDGIRGIPTRLALGVLTESRWWWALLFVFVPLSVLAGSLWITPQFANGIVGICGFLALTVWAVGYSQFRRSQVQINSGTRSLSVTHGDDASPFGIQERSVDLGRIESVSVHTLGRTTLIRIEDHTFSLGERFLSSDGFVVPTEQLPATLERLLAAGVRVPETGSTENGDVERSFDTVFRLVVTPLVLGGIPVAALLLFGHSILVTNGTVVIVLLGVVAFGIEIRDAWRSPP